MSDDVRARAEFEAWQMAWAPKGDECERASIEWDELDTPLARLTNGHVVSLEDEWEAWQASRAALAVAPATAQPVAWAVFAEDASVPAYVSASRNRADQVVDSEAGRIEGYRLVPLYAAPPATGDAAAVREACARVCESFKEQLWSGEAVPGTHAGSIATLLAAAIRALPLPAPATAVEEARKAVETASGRFALGFLDDWRKGPLAAALTDFYNAGRAGSNEARRANRARALQKVEDEVRALLAAEAAAKSNNTGDVK